MRRITLCCLTLCTLTFSFCAVAQEKKSSVYDRAEFAKLQKAMASLSSDFARKFAATATEEDREALMVEALTVIARKGTPLVNRALALVESRANDPQAVEVLTWIINQYPQSDAANKAAALLGKHHLRDKRAFATATAFTQAPMPWTEPLLRDFVNADLPKSQKAQALFALAQCLQTKAEIPHLVPTLNDNLKKIMAVRYGKDYFERLCKADSARLEAEALRTYQQLIAKYRFVKSDYSNYGEHAKRAIFEMQNLSIGKKAPEIKGEDIDAVAFKLSDYRGKVVVLTFWGHW